MKKPAPKPCPHPQTRLPAQVGKRVLAVCCSCDRLVVVPAEPERA